MTLTRIDWKHNKRRDIADQEHCHFSEVDYIAVALPYIVPASPRQTSAKSLRASRIFFGVRTLDESR